ncbi:sugar phosphate isomerase/epimerase family protein [Paenibacillus sp. FSL H7-0357]|uniref:sugar phosphate isomerase/epimerase family protein n=1 Tax=Paenibacillus sp. FSL H7-0357 TaxID=1536774 RepID=UPI00068A109B|nr:sugar phosphate isomerase/epimerase family protein [Paenibacillus sp. FSL H7-0357]
MTALQNCAVSTYVYIGRPLAEAIELLTAEGWKHIEIMCEGRHVELLEWTAGQLASLARKGKDLGIRWSIHAPITGCNPAAADEQQRAEAETLLLDTLRVAEVLECSYVVLHAGELSAVDTEETGAEPGGGALLEEAQATAGAGAASAGAREAAKARVVRFLQRILTETAGSAAVIALENVPPYPGLLGTEVTELLELAARVNSSRIGLVFDSGHALMAGKDRCLLMMQQAMPRAVALHLSDNAAEQDEHLGLGQGKLPLEAMLAGLAAGGFKGAWVLELRHPRDLLPSAAKLHHLRKQYLAVYGIEPVSGIR